ncbi:MAG: valine--tRNA ligase [Chloroflexi bacterium]|nr:valine--tRNA ligase [Chloroflexota bacterium]MDA8189162.1 valine--tRNA ligase [Dehalococcoidales bacterium]
MDPREPQRESQRVEMAKAYDHRTVEERLYSFWESNGYFTPKIDPKKDPFVISMPPPNVTGELHYGHAMFVAFEDLIIRWRRMQGRPSLWLPGTDHAGIATQNVVERDLAKQGLTRFDLGREKFVEAVWQWKEKYGGAITNQLRRMGASCDWSRERFTLDPGLSRAVRATFVRLYNKGLIYRGEYMINWCPRCATALSDLEVDHEERQAKLYFVRYSLVPEKGKKDNHITVATTRPETILGDTAVAVNPDDPRYRKLVGRKAILPEVKRVIPIIADSAVDPSFGTGAVKVTPAHDPTDYEIAKRHNLPAVNILNLDANMNENAGKYAGMDRYACRQELLDDLKAEGLLVKIDDYLHSVGHCEKCGTVVEPIISKQWFVRIKPLAEPAIETVRDGRIRFIPERFSKIYFNWMENIRDWCISRQLWWGHRIPVWYCGDCGELTVAVETPTNCGSCASPRITQDPDVLDTWFSSALWPFSTLGWPEETEDLRYFYPTEVMETGYDIIFFWVARMIMMGLECTGKVPFSHVYLHGLMRDEKGEKMSKSKGNVANPLDVVAKYGADALRFTILTGSTPGNDMKMSEEKLEAGRNFANKLWNAARYVQSVTPSSGLGDFQPKDSDYQLADRWIISRCNRIIADATSLLDQFQFGEAGRILYEFLWSAFCDWYIEISKITIYGKDSERQKKTTLIVLNDILDRMLRLLHPFMPFVTEEIWQNLAYGSESLMISSWPSPGPTEMGAEAQVELLIDVVRGIRNARAEFGVEPARRIEAIAVAGGKTRLLDEQRAIVTTLARVEPLTVHAKLDERPRQALHVIAGEVEIYLPLVGMVDIAAEVARIKKEIASVEALIARTEATLSKPEFVGKAPKQVIEKEQARLAGHRERVARLQERLKALS